MSQCVVLEALYGLVLVDMGAGMAEDMAEDLADLTWGETVAAAPEPAMPPEEPALSFAEIDRAADALVQILVTRSWDQPRFTARRTVT